MARPKKYETEEDAKAARARACRKYYRRYVPIIFASICFPNICRNRNNILDKRQKAYETARALAASTGRPVVPKRAPYVDIIFPCNRLANIFSGVPPRSH